MKTKLQIGPGKVYFPGWENVDIFSNHYADAYGTALNLPYSTNQFDLIYASHVLEHINRNMILTTLYHWKSLLKPGGVLRLAVPDFDAVCKYYTKTKDLKGVIGLMYGGQQCLLDRHCLIFNEETLTENLKIAGFLNIHKWDWRKTEHTEYDDYSQAYLPHMDKNTGTLMSLNLEATCKK